MWILDDGSCNSTKYALMISLSLFIFKVPMTSWNRMPLKLESLSMVPIQKLILQLLLAMVLKCLRNHFVNNYLFLYPTDNIGLYVHLYDTVILYELDFLWTAIQYKVWFGILCFYKIIETNICAWIMKWFKTKGGGLRDYYCWYQW